VRPDPAEREAAPPTEVLDLPPGPTDPTVDGPYEPSQEDDHR